MARPPARGVRVAQIAHPAVSRAPASFHTGVVESDKSLKVMGQSRSINMTLVLKGEKDEIHFVKPRTSFQDKLGEDRF